MRSSRHARAHPERNRSPIISAHLRNPTIWIAARTDGLETAVRHLGRDLGNFRAEVATGIGGLLAEVASGIRVLLTEVSSEFGCAEIRRFRTEVVGKLDAINANLEKFQARTNESLRFAGRAFTILTPVVISLIGGAFWITWHAAKLGLAR